MPTYPSLSASGRGCVFVALFLCFTKTYGQSSFDFLDAPGTAKLEALGGINVSDADEDVNLFLANPSLAGDTLGGVSAASVKLFPAGINQSVLTYAHHFKKAGLLLFGVEHMSYGDIDSYDETGAYLGTYHSGETALVIGKSHQLGNFRLGLNMKAAFSGIAGYHASAIAFDLGGVFIHPNEDLRVGLAIRNAGFVVNEYSSTSSSTLPFDVETGVTYKPAHMPARFSITVFNLGTTQNDTLNHRTNEPLSTLDKVSNHVNFGVELLLHRNFTVLVGYNFLRHRELSLENGQTSGFSLGLNARVKAFGFTVSRSSYFAGQAAYSFTIAINWNDILR